MGLYLCVFDDDEELDGVEVGPYENFGLLRELIVGVMEENGAGSRFPVLILHSDCDGEWTAAECAMLEHELGEVSRVFAALPAIHPRSDWQQTVLSQAGITPVSLLECFTDVDGLPLIPRLIELTRVAQRCKRPILFQ